MICLKPGKLPAFFLLLALFLSYCKKTAVDDKSSGTLQIIKNSSLANSSEALQAVFVSKDNAFRGYYYGNFSSDGKPDSIKSLVIHKTTGDTSVNISFDDSNRVKSVYMRFGSRRDTSLMSFDYSVTNQVSVRVHYYDSATNTSRLKFEYKVNTPAMTLVSSTQYASFGGGLLNIFNTLLQSNPAPYIDPFVTRYFSANAALPVLNAIIFTGITAIGCLIGQFLGCVLGGIVGEYVAIGPGSANASEIDKAPAGSPRSPSVPKVKVGDVLGGGVVISVDNTGQHGVVASFSDQSTGATWANAISLAAAHRGGGFANWRLPSYAEIERMYRYNALIGGFNMRCDNSNFSQCSYWSADPNGANAIWTLYFTSGFFWSNYTPSSIARVRAVRSF